MMFWVVARGLLCVMRFWVVAMIIIWAVEYFEWFLGHYILLLHSGLLVECCHVGGSMF